jgi:hypothetical protein
VMFQVPWASQSIKAFSTGQSGKNIRVKSLYEFIKMKGEIMHAS